MALLAWSILAICIKTRGKFSGNHPKYNPKYNPSPPSMHQYGEVQDRRLHEEHMAFVEARAQMEEVDNKVGQ